MRASLWWLVASFAACGEAKPPVSTPAPSGAPVATPAEPAAPSPAPSPPARLQPPVDTFSRESLPVWPVVPSSISTGRNEELELFAVNAAADIVLTETVVATNLITPATTKKLTGQLKVARRQDAFSSIASALAVDTATIKPKGRGRTVDLDFAAVPVADLALMLGDVGGISVVLAPGALPLMNVKVKGLPWDQALALIVERAGRVIIKQGTTHYIVDKGTKLPALRSGLRGGGIDLEARDAQLSQAAAALRGVTPLDLMSCSATKLSLSLRRVTLQEAVRALEVASGNVLVAPDECPQTVAGDPTVKLKILAVARAGTKRAVAFERAGVPTVSAEPQDFPYIVGSTATPLSPADWIATLTRTSALARRGQDWQAFVETSTGTELFWTRPARGAEPAELRFEVRDDGLHVFRDQTELKHLPLTP